MLGTSVHAFDGQLHDTLLPYRSKLLEISKIPTKDKIDSITNTKYEFTNVAKNVINMICTSNIENIESTNNLNALDVLYLILNEDLEKDFIVNLNEQLSDIMGGTCPSGRTTRMIQLYIQFTESRSYKK